MDHRPKKTPSADSQKPGIDRWIIVYLLLATGCILCTEMANSQTIGAAPIRRMSGAPIGDTSIMIYPFGGMLPSQSMTLKHPLLQDSVRISVCLPIRLPPNTMSLITMVEIHISRHFWNR